MKLMMNNLQKCFIVAKENNVNFIGVRVLVQDIEEVIIISAKNFDDKMKYYENSYNEDLTSKSQEMKIIGFTYGDTFEDIQQDLMSK